MSTARVKMELPQLPTQEDLWAFDVVGFLHLPAILSAAQVACTATGLPSSEPPSQCGTGRSGYL